MFVVLVVLRYYAFVRADGAGNNYSRVDKITFPADTKTTISATLTTARRDFSGMANSGVAGYFGGGNDGARLSGIDKITFPADTKTTLSATLTSASAEGSGMANAPVAGYFGGMANPSAVSLIDKITFPADSVVLVSAGNVILSTRL